MEIINYSEARANLKQVLDRVVNDQDSTIITRRDGDDSVIMAKTHYDSIMETLHLLRSPENARQLAEAIARDKNGENEYHDLN